MNVKEHLTRLKDADIRIIAKNLHISDINNDFTVNVLITRINHNININLVKILTENKHNDYFKDQGSMKSAINALKKLCFGVKEISHHNLKELKKIALVFDDGVIPDDIHEKLLSIWRPEFAKQLDDPIFYVNYTPFLKLLLILGYIHKGYITKYDDLKNIRIINGDILKSSVNFLEYKGITNLINKVEIKKNPDRRVFSSGDYKDINIFYNMLFNRLNIKIEEVFNTLAQLQGSDINWIDVEESEFILKKYDEVITKLLKYGCLLKAEENGRLFIQLSPDIWYFFRNQKPARWKNEKILITSDFEVFMPYFYDPYAIDIINHFSNLKNESLKDTNSGKRRPSKRQKKKMNNYDFINDYYLVFDIKERRIPPGFGYNYNEFLNCLGNNIPDIVNEEISEEYKRSC